MNGAAFGTGLSLLVHAGIRDGVPSLTGFLYALPDGLAGTPKLLTLGFSA